MMIPGGETEKAVINFGYGTTDRDFIAAYAEVKKAAVLAAMKTGDGSDTPLYTHVLAAIDELIAGTLDEFIVLGLKQGGAGTSFNMNINEAIARRASDVSGCKIDPISHVNIHQSTNDTFTTALTVMCYRHLCRVEEKIIRLQEALISKESEYSDVLVAGRTEMQFALPISLGKVFAAFAGPIERDRWRLHKLKERIRTIALGGTAIGTGFGAPAKYIFEAERQLRTITGLPLCRTQNMSDDIANADKYAELAGAYRIIALSIVKIAGDLILYSSGDINEIDPGELQYGSSIMPAKRNPVILEFIRGLAFSIQGECHKVDLYVQSGQFQLNAYLPFVADSLISIYHDMSILLEAFLDRFLSVFTVNAPKAALNLANSGVLLNILVPELGYHAVKELYYKAKDAQFNSPEDIKKFIITHTQLTDSRVTEIFKNMNSIS